ncbi:MAG TPA: hypothetical protein VGP93_08715, partial [Polyangiaceae bacterium]|nr:hypothetical protein [Polyangiaceae bacterium]
QLLPAAGIPNQQQIDRQSFLARITNVSAQAHPTAFQFALFPGESLAAADGAFGKATYPANVCPDLNSMPFCGAPWTTTWSFVAPPNSESPVLLPELPAELSCFLPSDSGKLNSFGFLGVTSTFDEYRGYFSDIDANWSDITWDVYRRFPIDVFSFFVTPKAHMDPRESFRDSQISTYCPDLCGNGISFPDPNNAVCYLPQPLWLQAWNNNCF